MKRLRLFVFLGMIALFVASPSTVLADTEECSTSTGSYGQTSTTCKVLGETTISHEVVGAGVGDINFWFLAGGLITAAGLFYGVSKLTQKVYWFD